MNAKNPVILDTDIGSDIDDTWALAMLLKSPELDLKLVVTELFDTVAVYLAFAKELLKMETLGVTVTDADFTRLYRFPCGAVNGRYS